MPDKLGQEYIRVWTTVLSEWLGWPAKDVTEWIAGRTAKGEVEIQVLSHEPPIWWVIPVVARAIVPALERAELGRLQTELYLLCLKVTDAWGPTNDAELQIACNAVRDLLHSRGMAIRRHGA
jgi:hypothetical protein